MNECTGNSCFVKKKKREFSFAANRFFKIQLILLEQMVISSCKTFHCISDSWDVDELVRFIRLYYFVLFFLQFEPFCKDSQTWDSSGGFHKVGCSITNTSSQHRTKVKGIWIYLLKNCLVQILAFIVHVSNNFPHKLIVSKKGYILSPIYSWRICHFSKIEILYVNKKILY